MTTTQGIEFLDSALMPTAVLAIPEALESGVTYEFSMTDAGILTPTKARMGGMFHTELIGGATQVTVNHGLGTEWVKAAFWLVNPSDGMFKEYHPVAVGPVNNGGVPSQNAIAVDFGNVVPPAGSIRVLVVPMISPDAQPTPTPTPAQSATPTPTALPAPSTGEPVVGTATPNTLSRTNSDRTYNFDYNLTGLTPGTNGFIAGLFASTSNNFGNRTPNFSFTSTPAQNAGYIPVNGTTGRITVTLPADWAAGDYKLGFAQSPSPTGVVIASIPFRVI